MRRLQISLEPEQRCEQIEDREREHWLEAVAYGLQQPKEREDMSELEKKLEQRKACSEANHIEIGLLKQRVKRLETLLEEVGNLLFLQATDQEPERKERQWKSTR